MSIRDGIKKTLGLLNRAISQIPQTKRALFFNRVNNVLEKYKETGSQTQLQTFLKQLQFNVNFIKLSYPQLNFEQPPKEQEKPQLKDDFFQLEIGDNKIKHEPIKITQRKQVEFSNWFEGNADPENLKRHKQLLERQYFGGDYWKGKQKPTSPSKQYLMEMMVQDQENKHNGHVVNVVDKVEKPPARFKDDHASRFEKVKR